MRFKSFSKSLEGVVKEILGTAFSVGCQVDGKSPKAIQDAIASGEIDSECKRQSPTALVARCGARSLWVRRPAGTLFVCCGLTMLMIFSTVPEE